MITQAIGVTSVALAILVMAITATVLSESVTFRTRSGRGTNPLPPGCGPRGPVGPSDPEIRVEDAVATVDGAGRRGAPYQAFPPDDAPAFRRALSEAEARGGGLVFIPPGVYRIDEIVTVPGNVVLQGAGRATQLHTTRLEGGSGFVTGGNRIRFTQFRFQGPSTVRMVQNMAKGIHVTAGVTGCLIDHVELSGFGYFAIGVTDGAEATVEYVYDHHNTQNGYGYAVMVVTGGKVLVRDSEFEQNRHAIASNSTGTSYQCLYSYLHGDDDTYQVGALDTHAGMSGEIEIAYNVIEYVRTGLSLSDGSGRIHHNWIRNVQRFCSIREGTHNGKVIPGAEVHDMVFENNHLENVKVPFEIQAGRNIVVDGDTVR